MKKLIMTIALLSLLMLGCSNEVGHVKIEDQVSFDAAQWSLEESPLNGMTISDNALLYDDSRDLSLDYIYLTVMPTYDKEGQALTLDDINKVRDFRLEVPELNIYFQEGDAEGPFNDKLTFETLQTNGSLTLRGHSTRRAPQKSYKVRLSDSVDLWHGQSVLNLNKHPYDPMRVLNAMTFDLLEDIPDITSVQTQFVRVFIRDLSSDVDKDIFKDYGYFTHVEQANKKYLQAHGLDRSGHLYKVEYYEFYDSPALVSKSDPSYDLEAFEAILEIKEGNDHEKLLAMVKDVNDYNLAIDQVMTKHFQEDNALTWLAFNILVGNYDTQTQNYFLYSPQNAMTWYFMPWDYDGAFGEDGITSLIKKDLYIGKRHRGIGQYWNTVLWNRYFKYPEHVKKLNDKIEEIYTYLSPEVMKDKTDKYYTHFRTSITSMPDLEHIESDIQGVFDQYDALYMIPRDNRAAYYESLEDPMPVFMGEVVRTEDKKIQFVWDKSFDLQNNPIHYSLEIADNPDFVSPIYEADDILLTQVALDLDINGTHYWRLTVWDDQGHYQYPFDSYRSDDGKRYQGVRVFTLAPISEGN